MYFNKKKQPKRNLKAENPYKKENLHKSNAGITIQDLREVSGYEHVSELEALEVLAAIKGFTALLFTN